jgi:hypothetical protein
MQIRIQNDHILFVYLRIRICSAKNRRPIYCLFSENLQMCRRKKGRQIIAESCQIIIYMEHSPVHCHRHCRRRSADTIVQSVGEQDVYFR